MPVAWRVHWAVPLLLAGLLAAVLPIAMPADATFSPAADVATTSHMTLPSQQHSAIWAGGRGYVLGGWSTPGGIQQGTQVLVYDPVTGTSSASPLAQLSSSRIDGAAVWAGNKAFYFGGRDGFGAPTSSIFVFDPTANGGMGKVSLSPVALPYPVAVASAVWTGSKAYIFGGTDSTVNLDTIIEFNPGSMPPTATKIALPLPHPVAGTTAIWDGTAAYLFGGTISDGSTSSNTNLIVKFVPPGATATGTAEPATAILPTFMTRASSFWDGSRAYILGGLTNTGPQDWIGEFDPAAGTVLTWSHVLPYAEQMADTAWDAEHKCAFLFGGSSVANAERDDVVTIGEPPCLEDQDGDGVRDAYDNCPVDENTNQADLDLDGLGDVCDPDIDGDSVLNVEDNCPVNFNTSQEDLDADGVGDVCDPDVDGDGVLDVSDNCRFVVNADQEDLDGDRIGDACDPDWDNDFALNDDDNCPRRANRDQSDVDGDGLGDKCDPDMDNDTIPNFADNCPRVPNLDQVDQDRDGIGDACDPDWDGDGVANLIDNCPRVPNTNQSEIDGDGLGDACDPDMDGDSILNGADNCMRTPNPDQADGDLDGVGDACEADLDHDGILNLVDNCVMVPNPSQTDLDHDGLGDACDPDMDGDAIANGQDNCVTTPNHDQANVVHPSAAGDACEDPDLDGVTDATDNCPDMANDQANQVHPATRAGDACEDPDTDGRADRNDNCPDAFNPSQQDTDHDGLGNACDPPEPVVCPAPGVAFDADGDGRGDWCVFPFVESVAAGSTPFYWDAPSADTGGAYVTGQRIGFHVYANWTHQQWVWTFDDGTTAKGPDVSHRFMQPGLHKITMHSDNGVTEAWLEIRGSLPVADFSATPATIGVGMDVAFSDSSRTDRSFGSWVWDFGDGATGQGPAPHHKYSEPGTYTVTLVATELGPGARAHASHQVTVLPAPTAVVGRALRVTSGDLVTLNGTSSINPTGAALVYDWAQVAGPAVPMPINGAALRFVAPAVSAETDLTLTLQVIGETGTSELVQVRVTVMPAAGSVPAPEITLKSRDVVTRSHGALVESSMPWALIVAGAALGTVLVVATLRKKKAPGRQ